MCLKLVNFMFDNIAHLIVLFIKNIGFYCFQKVIEQHIEHYA